MRNTNATTALHRLRSGTTTNAGRPRFPRSEKVGSTLPVWTLRNLAQPERGRIKAPHPLVPREAQAEDASEASAIRKIHASGKNFVSAVRADRSSALFAENSSAARTQSRNPTTWSRSRGPDVLCE